MAMGHIKVIVDQEHNVIEDGADTTERDLAGQEPYLPERPRTGFHVRPVPIDEPLGE